MIAAPGLEVALELRARLADLYCAYDDALDEGEFERWPEFFTEECLYKVTTRENYELGLPVALIYGESRRMLADRVVALRETALYAPRTIRRLTSAVRLLAADGDGMRLSGSLALCQTLLDRPSELFLCGRRYDRIVEQDGGLLFAERVCVCDSTVIPISLVYPV